MRGGTEELGPYRIVRKIAAGGMAEIYLARHRGIEGLERTVVIKQILEKHEQNEEFVTMFLDEARLMAALSHPNIAQVFDLGRSDDTHYLVMEYVRGPTLGAMLSAAQRAGQPSLPEKPALGIALAIAEALHYVHERRDDLGRPLGIVHRDLNPSNVVVSYDGAVKLIDFGIAKAATKVYETRTGVIKGTYGYIAPEALTGTGVIDRRADVFALGILLYEMLVGKHPFDVSDEPNLLDRILEARYKRPRDVRPDIPLALDRVIARCLTPHPEGRPESVVHLIDELTAHMASKGIVPTQRDLAACARELVPDAEGPAPLRRPTSMKPRPLFPRDGGFGREGDAKDGGTRRVPSSMPPAEDEPTRRAMPALPEELPPRESTRKVALPRASVPPSPPPRARPALDAPDTLPETRAISAPPPALDAALATALGALPVEDELPTQPAAPRPDRTTPVPSRSVQSGVYSGRAMPSWDIEPNTTQRLRAAETRRGIHPVIGALGLLAAGALAFAAARAVGGARPPEPVITVMPPVAALIPPPASGESPVIRALHVVSEPTGAAITVDGVDAGAHTPAVIAIDTRVGEVVIGVSLADHVPQARTVSSSIGEARFVLDAITSDAGVTSEAGIAGDPRARPRRRPRRQLR